MATIECSLEQIVEAVRRLSLPERTRLMQELMLQPPISFRRRAARLRTTFRAPAQVRRRMALLLRKGNAGTLTPSESSELDRLVQDSERRTLAMTVALDREIQSTLKRRSRKRSNGK